VARLCEVCRRREAIGRCRICGRWACSSDLGSDGVCSLCRDTLCSFCRRRLAVAACEVCGRLVCDECGVQVTPVAWLCPECARKYLGGEWPPRRLAAAEVERLATRLASLIRSPRVGRDRAVDAAGTDS
jgi:hypothetical protein